MDVGLHFDYFISLPIVTLSDRGTHTETGQAHHTTQTSMKTHNTTSMRTGGHTNPEIDAESGFSTCISVVTPSFNQLDLLKLCAASVADQTGSYPVEHIIQDGGSDTDFTRWTSEQKFAICHREADTGMYDAINRGFRRAQGDILAWLNCDEQYLPGTLRRVAEYFTQHPDTDILFGDVIVVDERLNPLFYRKALIPSVGQIRYNFLPTYSAATFIRRRVIDAGHFLDDSFRAIADAEWIIRLLKHGCKTGVLNKPLATFMQSDANLGQSEAGLLESRRWRATKSPIDLGLKILYRLDHHLKKILCGAYSTRRINVALYHPGEARRRTIEMIIGGKFRISAKCNASNH